MPSSMAVSRRQALWRQLFCLLAGVVIISGCSSTIVRNAVPKERVNSVQVAGMTKKIRYWGGHEDPDMRRDLVASVMEHPMTQDPDDENGPGWGVLVLSGGGDVGAFGAGILCGWTDRGDRPRFRVVTGVSTGALTAPLAFLGPRYDPQLKEAYTSIEQKDVLRMRSWLVLLRSDSLADSKPLQELAARLITDKVLREIAQEHAKGRRLYIQTVNLDAQQPVIWDMGAIASSGRPDALMLFRQVMIASAAIPGVFPPQYIRVESEGKVYEEMHVDGGTVSQMLLYTIPVNFTTLQKEGEKAGAFREGRRARVYVIRNGSVQPEWQAVSPKILPIAGRAISTMTKFQAGTELDLMYYTAKDAGADFYFCHLPEDYVRKVKDDFNKEEMNRMFNLGYDLARRGDPWRRTPLKYAEQPANGPVGDR